MYAFLTTWLISRIPGLEDAELLALPERNNARHDDFS